MIVAVSLAMGLAQGLGAQAAGPASDLSPRQRLQQARSYYCYYGPGRADELSRYDVAIMRTPKADDIEGIRQTAADVTLLNARGVLTIGYISVGEDQPIRTGDGKGPGGMASWYFDRDNDGQPDGNTTWKSFYTNAAHPGFRADRVAEARRIVHDMGYQGIFLDTIATAEAYPQSREGMFQLVAELRDAIGDRALIINGASDFLPHIGPHVDGVMLELFTTRYNWGTSVYEACPNSDLDATRIHYDTQLRPAMAQWPIKLFALDYCEPQQRELIEMAYDRAATFDALPCVAPIGLDQIYTVGYVGKPDPKYLGKLATPESLAYILPETRNGLPAGTRVVPSSCYPNYTVAPIVNGIKDRTALHWMAAAWASAETAEEHWLELRFSEPVAGGTLQLTWVPPSRTYRIDVRDSNDKPWRTIATETDNTRQITTCDLPATPIAALRIIQAPGAGHADRPNLMWLAQLERITP